MSGVLAPMSRAITHTIHMWYMDCLGNLIYKAKLYDCNSIYKDGRGCPFIVFVTKGFFVHPPKKTHVDRAYITKPSW